MTIAVELGKTLAELEDMTLLEERYWLARIRKNARG